MTQRLDDLIARRVRMARELAGLSQAQVAGLLGLHRPTISEIEAGRRRLSAAEAGTLAQVLDVDLAWLLGHKSDEPDDPRLDLAARELSKLHPDDLDRLLTIIKTLRGGEER